MSTTMQSLFEETNIQLLNLKTDKGKGQLNNNKLLKMIRS